MERDSQCALHNVGSENLLLLITLCRLHWAPIGVPVTHIGKYALADLLSVQLLMCNFILEGYLSCLHIAIAYVCT